MTCTRILTMGLLVCLAASAGGGEFMSFRGPAGTGISDETGVPTHWGPDNNIKWKTPLPGPGNSSPIVVGKRVFVTCASDGGKDRGLYCFDRDSGRQVWSQVVRFEAEDPTHQTNPYCGSSPASDGRRIVAWHGSAGLFCYDLEGNELWSRDLGVFRHIWGYGSSPVFHEASGAILLNCGPGKRTFVTAIDPNTGETIWQVDEPGGDEGQETPGEKPIWVGSWSTPVVATVEGREQVIVSLPRHVQGYDPRTGEVLWSCDGLGDLVYTSCLVEGPMAVAMGGYHGPAIGFKLGGSGNITETNRLWHVSERNPQRIGSGVIIDRHIYMANADGVAQCLELATGKEIWKDRLPGGGVWGSILAADGRWYVTNQAGTTHVFAPNAEKLELLASNELGEPSNSTPALSDGQIFLRTFGHLYCVEEGPH
ncbi:MAG: PQQ-binding-like beta-propeller repeat protein [Pirellulales bacterium]